MIHYMTQCLLVAVHELTTALDSPSSSSTRKQLAPWPLARDSPRSSQSGQMRLALRWLGSTTRLPPPVRESRFFTAILSPLSNRRILLLTAAIPGPHSFLPPRAHLLKSLPNPISAICLESLRPGSQVTVQSSSRSYTQVRTLLRTC